MKIEGYRKAFPILQIVENVSGKFVEQNLYITKEKFRRDKLSGKNFSENVFAEISAVPKGCHTETFRNWKLLYFWHHI